MNLIRLLLPLVPSLLQLLPVEQLPKRHLARRLALRAALIVVPLILLLAAAVFAVAALYMALAEALSPAAAAGILALVLCLVAAVEAAIVLYLERVTEARQAGAARESREHLAHSLEGAGRLIAAKPVPSVLVAVAAGALVALLARRR